MSYLVMEGGRSLRGTVAVSGAKNASLKLMVATLLGEGLFVLENVPRISDVFMMGRLLESLGAKVVFSGNRVEIRVHHLTVDTPRELMQQMRASILVMGPLLARLGQIRLALPGGCAIGTRPVDLHLSNLRKLGVEFTEQKGEILGRTKGLSGTLLHLDFPSVGATENLMMAATLAKGCTRIENAAREPEIVQLQEFLNSMGAKVSGAGTSCITIHGVARLGESSCRVMPDRIEAGTFIVLGALCGDEIKVEGVHPPHLTALFGKLTEAGVDYGVEAGRVIVRGGRSLLPIHLVTKPYPGFPTDLQPQMVSLLTQAQGVSTVEDTIYPERFKQIPSLHRMGADITLLGNKACIRGGVSLSGGSLQATDLRAGAGLVIAGLVAKGQSTLEGLPYILRGYEDFLPKLQALGAAIWITHGE